MSPAASSSPSPLLPFSPSPQPEQLTSPSPQPEQSLIAQTVGVTTLRAACCYCYCYMVQDLPLFLWLPCLAAGVVQHMFPAGRQLSQLTNIYMQGMHRDAEFMDKPCMTGAELASLISCCPALHKLQICNSLEASADVSPLMQLPPCCTNLQVGGPAFGDEAAGVVCQLTQLRELTWFHSKDLTDRGVKKLTALTRLWELDMWRMQGLSDCIINTVEDDKDALHLEDTAEVRATASQAACCCC